MKKWMKVSLLLILVVFLSGTGYVFIKTSYTGNDKIVLLNSGATYTSFQNIIQRPEFKNKIVYVDVWGTSCPPCFDELKNYTPQLTQRYKDAADIAFLYICIDRHPLPEVRWKDKIQLFKPAGYHILVEGDEEPRLAKDVIGEAVNEEYFPYVPYYFIVDKQGHITHRPSINPEDGEIRPSGKNLLYHKLDSLRRL